MILYRAMQGFFGGAIMPTVFPVVYTIFRGPQLPTMMVMISIILNLSSTLGPTIGGFPDRPVLLALAVSGQHRARASLVAAVVWLTIDIDKPDLSLLRNFDLIGLVLMAVFLGCLEYVLEEGPRWDWFDDGTIRTAIDRLGCRRRCSSSGGC